MVAKDKVTQSKDKDFDMIIPKVDYTDQSDELQEIAYEICKEAYSKCSINDLYFETNRQSASKRIQVLQRHGSACQKLA